MADYKAGDVVKCINRRYAFKSLTKGKYYDVVSVSPDGKYLRVLADTGIVTGWDKDMFELFVPANAVKADPDSLPGNIDNHSIDCDCGPCIATFVTPTPPQVLGNALPEDDALRLEYPMFDGLMAYFPNALAEVSRVSKVGNDQHNPGQPMHWARDKSTDHGNKIMRHLVDAGGVDAKGIRHSARLAWRALALLQEELERDCSLPASRASKGKRTFDK